MSQATTSISRNLPDFPYSCAPAPAPAARKPFCALFSNSHFVTTVVSPASHPPDHLSSCSSSFSDPADPEPADFFSAQASPSRSSPSSPAFPPSPAPADQLLSARITSSLLRSSRQPSHSQPSVKQPPPRVASEISKRPSSLRASARRLKSSKSASAKTASSPPLPLSKHPSRSAFVASGGRGSPAVNESGGSGSFTTQSLRRMSSWRRLKRMGNRIVTPFQSISMCITGGRSFCEDPSSGLSSPGSSWYSSGEYSPEYIRAVIENNVLLEHLTLD